MVMIGDITRLSYLLCPAVISTINHSEDLKKSRDKATTKLSRAGATLYITYITYNDYFCNGEVTLGWGPWSSHHQSIKGFQKVMAIPFSNNKNHGTCRLDGFVDLLCHFWTKTRPWNPWEFAAHPHHSLKTLEPRTRMQALPGTLRAKSDHRIQPQTLRSKGPKLREKTEDET